MMPSNKKFGYFFSVIFAFAGIYVCVRIDVLVSLILMLVALLIFAIAVYSPNLLSAPNRIWFKVGLLMGKVVSPIVLGFIFYFIITPVAFFTRLFGRDELRLKRRSVESYWIRRTQPAPSSNSFKNQF